MKLNDICVFQYFTASQIYGEQWTNIIKRFVFFISNILFFSLKNYFNIFKIMLSSLTINLSH